MLTNIDNPAGNITVLQGTSYYELVDYVKQFRISRNLSNFSFHIIARMDNGCRTPLYVFYYRRAP